MKKTYIAILIIVVLLLTGLYTTCAFYYLKNQKTEITPAKSNYEADFITSLLNSKEATYTNIIKHQKDRDKIFYNYLRTLEKKANLLNKNLPKQVLNATDINDIPTSLIDVYKNVGIGFNCVEKPCTAVIDYSTLYSDFNKILSPQYNTFLILKSEENIHKCMVNGEIIVPYEVIRQRINSYEKLLEDYPNFIERQDIIIKIRKYYDIYKNGSPKSPVLCENTVNKSELEKIQNIEYSYSKFLDEYRNKKSEYYNGIKVCYQKMILAKNASTKELRMLENLTNEEKELDIDLKSETDITERDDIFAKYLTNTQQNIKLINKEICNNSCRSEHPVYEFKSQSGTDIVVNDISMSPVFKDSNVIDKLKIVSPGLPMMYMMHSDTIYFEAALNYNYLYNKYADYLSDSWKEYLLIYSTVENDLDGYSIFFADKSTLSLEKLLNYVVKWQRFQNKYPDFVINSEINRMLDTDYYPALISYSINQGSIDNDVNERILVSLDKNSSLYKKYTETVEQYIQD